MEVNYALEYRMKEQRRKQAEESARGSEERKKDRVADFGHRIMAMRDELIEAAARAMAERKHPGFVRMGGLLDKHIAAEIQSATTALDAILELMEDAEMDTLRAGYEAMFVSKWDGTQAPMMGAGWDAMLATIRSPKI